MIDFDFSNNKSFNLPQANVSDSKVLKDQYKIFKELEKSYNFVDAISLGQQVNFQNTYTIPVQRWFPYREGYNVELVNSFIKYLDIKGLVFDPFSGSGTTLLSSRLNNLPSIGIDVNPISVLVSKAGNEQYEESDINDLNFYLLELKQAKRSSVNYSTKFELASKVFNNDILQALLQIREYVKQIENKKISRLFFVAWLAVVEGVSNIRKEGNGIKYKNRKRTPKGYVNIEQHLWEEEYFPKDKFNYVKQEIINKLLIMKEDIEENYGTVNKKPRIYNEDCLEFDRLFDEEVELTFFSPPYCNCFDYFEIHKVELWLGEFVNSQEEMRELRSSGFRSNTNSVNGKPISYKNDALESIVELFDYNSLWSKKIPDVVRGYFDDMHTFLSKLYVQTTKGGYVSVVVGNSAYTGVIVPTDLLIGKIAEEVGFEVKNIYVTRHLTTSSQQKKKLEELRGYLRESIILLRKV